MTEHDAIVEVPLLGFLKWRSNGSLDFVSPIPSPFNYGSVPETTSGDGEPLDAIILGPRLPRGVRVRLPERGRVRFTDAGEEDPKLVLSASRITCTQRTRIVGFFHVYSRWKRILNLVRGRHGPTRFEALDLHANRG